MSDDYPSVFPRPISPAPAGEVTVPTCRRCGDPMTGGCTGTRCVVNEALVDEALVEPAARYLYDLRYGPGSYENRFGAGGRAGSDRHTALLDEMHALLGSHLIAEGWKPPDR